MQKHNPCLVFLALILSLTLFETGALKETVVTGEALSGVMVYYFNFLYMPP